MRKHAQLYLFILLVMTSLGANAIELSAKAGTLGLGLDLNYQLNRFVSARAGLNYLPYSDTIAEGGNDFDVDINLNTLGVLLDVRPFAGGFRISTGVFVNSSELSMDTAQQVSYDVGNDTYTGNLQLNGSLTFQPVAPYLGIGYDLFYRSKFSIGAELGILYQGSPNVSLTGTGTADLGGGNTINVGSDPLFQENLRVEEQNLEDDIDQFSIYPVISLNLSYRF